MIGYTNQLGKVTRSGYDVLGRKIAETNANNEVMTYTYNAAGDMLTLTDGKQHTREFRYDQFGRVTNKYDALGNSVLRFKYDAIGRLTNRWSAAKGDTFYSYDKAGNLTSVNYPVSADITFEYDALNRRTNMVDGVGTTRWTYTSFGATRTEDGPWLSDTITYDYQTNHLQSAFTGLQANGSALIQSYGYDTANRLQTLTSPAGQFTYSYSSGVGTPSTASLLIQKILYPNSAYVTNSWDSVARLAFTKLKNSA